MPYQTAFYGTMCHEKDPLYNNRFTALLESSKLLKKGVNAEGVEQYTLSRWITNRPLKLAVFVHDSIYPDVKNNRLLSMAKEAFLKHRTFIDEPLQFDVYEKFVGIRGTGTFIHTFGTIYSLKNRYPCVA